MAAETLPLSSGAVANGDLSSNPNPIMNEVVAAVSRRRTPTPPKPPPASLMMMIPRRTTILNGFFFFLVCVISFVWDIGICDSKGCLIFSRFWFMIVEVRVYVC